MTYETLDLLFLQQHQQQKQGKLRIKFVYITHELLGQILLLNTLVIRLYPS